MLDPRRVLTFREVARLQSFSRAAQSLALTQPAVSQQIRALEVQLGDRLIERRRPGFALTAAGELLYAHADALFERLQLAETQLREARVAERRQLRLGAFPSVLGRLVPRVVAKLDVELNAIQGETDALVAGVRDGTLHLAVCFQDAAQPRREHEGTRRIDVLEEPMVAVLPPKHRLAGRKRVKLRELAEEPWLVAIRGGVIERACLAAGFEPRIEYLTDDPLTINGIVAAGLTVTLTSQMLAAQFRGVATIGLAEPVHRSIYAVLPPAGMHPLAEPFVDALRSVSRSAGVSR
jgi:DNA-binding transcriptional LysR family regulator